MRDVTRISDSVRQVVCIGTDCPLIGVSLCRIDGACGRVLIVAAKDHGYLSAQSHGHCRSMNSVLGKN